jgi:hypothetical protein
LEPGERKEILRASTSDYNANETVVAVSLDSSPELTTWRTLAEPRGMRWQKPKYCLEEGLCLRIEGLAYDLSLDDPKTGSPLILENENLTGRRAITLANDAIQLQGPISSSRIRARTLAGTEILNTDHAR